MTSLNVVSYIEYSTLQHLYARVVIELRATAVDVGFSFENIVWKRAEVLTWFMSFVATATRDASMSLSLKQRCLKLMVDTCRNVPAIAACLDWLKVPHKTVRKTAALLYVFEKGNFTWTFIVFGSARYAGWRGRCSIFFFWNVNEYLCPAPGNLLDICKKLYSCEYTWLLFFLFLLLYTKLALTLLLYEEVAQWMECLHKVVTCVWIAALAPTVHRLEDTELLD